MDLQALIKEKCLEKNLTISRLEKKLGFSNGYIKAIKEPIVNFERAKAISDELGIPLHLLAKGIPEPAKDAPADSIEDENLAEIASKFGSESMDDIKMLFGLNEVGRAEIRGEMRQMLRLKKYNDLLS